MLDYGLSLDDGSTLHPAPPVQGVDMKFFSNFADESNTDLISAMALTAFVIVMEAALAIMFYEKSVMLFEMSSSQSSFWAKIAAMIVVFAVLVTVLYSIRFFFGCAELYRRLTKERMKGDRTLSNT